MPWFWEYPEDYTEITHLSRAVPRYAEQRPKHTRLRTTYWGHTTYYHCPHCPRGYYDQDAARSCCSDLMRERRYLDNREQQLIRLRFTITLDAAAT